MIHAAMNLVGVNELVEFVISDRESVIPQGRNIMIGYVCAFRGDGYNTAAVTMISRVTMEDRSIQRGGSGIIQGHG